MKKLFNRRARFEYQLLKNFEAGIALTGAEVKSIKEGHLQLEDAFARFKEGELWLTNAHIHPYRFAANENYDPYRDRKLLLHQQELRELSQKTQAGGLTIVPVSCYTKGQQIKLEIAIARGKKKYEKREAIKKKDLQREVENQLKGGE